MNATPDPIDWLNQACFCITVDPQALRHELELDPATRDLQATLATTHPHLFARNPIFVGRDDVVAMRALVEAVEAVVRLPSYRDAVLEWAPDIARFDPGTVGALSSFDFHLTPSGPKLIEINTNAGGAFLNAALARAQRACCTAVLQAIDPSPGVPPDEAPLTDRLHEMFLSEWRLQRGDQARLRRVAIVDQAPAQQYLYPEFLLAAHLFRSHGIDAVVCDPGELTVGQGTLRHASGAIDLVYNRLTDFALDEPSHQLLRQAYLEGLAVVTPHPRAHALYADKRNLVVLGDIETLRHWGADEAHLAALATSVPRTEHVTVDRAEELWARRRALFFKPVTGYGGKATYRGDKLTRRVWGEILAGDYVAQELVAPSGRSVRIDTEPAAVTMKLDVRCYSYGGRVLALAARLYQGQVTNFRTPGGGFATVFSLP
jgi:hypothetical protein